MHTHAQRTNARAGQAGLTLIEFMISIVLGMIVVAAISMLVANQSVTRSEVDRTGRMIENGRYAIQTIADDLTMAGYLGELASTPSYTGALPDPCSAALADVQNNMGVHVQGYDGATLTTATLPSCVSNWKSGTDIVVVRRVDPDTSGIMNGTAVDLTKLKDGQYYLQTGLASATGTTFSAKLLAAASSTNATNFNLVNKSGAIVPPRQMLTRLYYVATCDVCSGTSADSIPTLKRVDLTLLVGPPASMSMSCSGCTISIAEGVENLHLDYGKDTDSDGAPDGTDTAASAASLGTVDGSQWQNVMSAKVYVIARTGDTSPQYADTKTYAMGTASYTPATADRGYERHLFMQSVKMVNPSLRRSS